MDHCSPRPSADIEGRPAAGDLPPLPAACRRPSLRTRHRCRLPARPGGGRDPSPAIRPKRRATRRSAGIWWRRCTCAASLCVENILITNGSNRAWTSWPRSSSIPVTRCRRNPTYLAAIQAFQSYEARFVPVPTDEHGLHPEALPALIEQHRPKFLLPDPEFPEPERPHAQRGPPREDRPYRL